MRSLAVLGVSPALQPVPAQPVPPAAAPAVAAARSALLVPSPAGWPAVSMRAVPCATRRPSAGRWRLLPFGRIALLGSACAPPSLLCHRSRRRAVFAIFALLSLCCVLWRRCVGPWCVCVVCTVCFRLGWLRENGAGRYDLVWFAGLPVTVAAFFVAACIVFYIQKRGLVGTTPVISYFCFQSRCMYLHINQDGRITSTGLSM